MNNIKSVINTMDKGLSDIDDLTGHEGYKYWHNWLTSRNSKITDIKSYSNEKLTDTQLDHLEHEIYALHECTQIEDSISMQEITEIYIATMADFIENVYDILFTEDDNE